MPRTQPLGVSWPSLCGGTIAGDVKSVHEAMDREDALEDDGDDSD